MTNAPQYGSSSWANGSVCPARQARTTSSGLDRAEVIRVISGLQQCEPSAPLSMPQAT